MIRHSNSLLISLFIHFLLVILIFFISKSYVEVKEEKEKIIVLNVSTIEFEEKVKTLEVPKEQYCAPKKVQEIKEKPKKVQEIKKEKVVVDKKVKEEIKQEIKEEKTVESPTEIKSDNIAQNRSLAQIKKENTTPSEITKQPTLQEEYSEVNKHKILELLRDNLYYPMSARKRNITGMVKVSFTLDTDAKVSNTNVSESQSDILSRAAIKTIEDLSGKFPKPKKEITLSIPINYNLK